MIEIVSRGNKSGRRRLDRFVEKASRLLDDGIHLLIIDPFPPGRLDPGGVHTLIWEDETGEKAHALEGDQRVVASCCSVPRLKAYLQPLSIGQSLPDAALFWTLSSMCLSH